ncbi:MAG: hypothetical protein ACI9VR_000049 [Cognaticolwellia sp.]|jgi:hypothetical protein
MAGQYVRLMDAGTITQGPQSQDAVDLGAYRQVVFHLRLLKAGSGTAGAQLVVQHAAIDEEGAYIDIPGISWVVDSNGTGGVLDTTTFMRFVRVAGVGTFAGDPVALLDLVAKE